MNNITQNIFKQALSLDPIERAKLIEELFQSLSPTKEDRAKEDRSDTLWSEEAESRIAGYDAGKIKVVSVVDALTRLKNFESLPKTPLGREPPPRLPQ